MMSLIECGREDLNLHPRKDQDLNLARLPISPRPREDILGLYVMRKYCHDVQREERANR